MLLLSFTYIADKSLCKPTSLEAQYKWLRLTIYIGLCRPQNHHTFRPIGVQEVHEAGRIQTSKIK